MSPSRFLVSFEGDRWRVARVSGGREESVEIPLAAGADDVPDTVAGRLRQWGWSGGGVCLGLPSDWVLPALIDCADLPRKGRAEAMRYRLEEQLPLDAERLTADFMPASGSRVFGLAVDTSRVRGVLSQLSAQGISAAAISATALLALRDVSQRLAAKTDFVIVAGDSSLELFRMVNGRPEAWNTVPHRAEDIVQACRASRFATHVEGRKATAAVIGAMDPVASHALAQDGRIEVRSVDEGPTWPAAARGAASMLADDAEGWANFRRGELAPSSPWGEFPALLRMTAVLAVALPAVLAAVFLWRAAQYESSARESHAKQAAEYIRVFPNTPVPASVASRFKSEVTRCTSLNGAGAKLPEQRNAIESLRRVVAALPDGLVRVREIRAEPTEVTLDGESRSHADAEQVARALRAAGFEVEPPRSEVDPRGLVSFTIAAKCGGADSDKAAAVSGPVAGAKEALP